MTSQSQEQTSRRWRLGLAVPLLVSLTAGCHALNFLRPRDKPDDRIEKQLDRAARSGLPSKYQVRVAPFVFVSDWEIPRDQPLFKELADLRDQVQKELLLPPGDTVVQVYLFDTKERYESYLKEQHPTLPSRRAFFLKIPRTLGDVEDLHVYTYWSKRIRQDLRHELTHSLLNSVIRDVPQWLDEGLAEYFETPPEQKTINTAHVQTLRKSLSNGTYKLSLSRLEGLTKVEEMGPAEYREAWAWVHLMLKTRPEAKTVLLSYLQQLRGKRHPGPLAPKLAKVCESPDETLLEHLARLESDAPQMATAIPADANDWKR
jgi:hypothetical protein